MVGLLLPEPRNLASVHAKAAAASIPISLIRFFQPNSASQRGAQRRQRSRQAISPAPSAAAPALSSSDIPLRQKMAPHQRMASLEGAWDRHGNWPMPASGAAQTPAGGHARFANRQTRRPVASFNSNLGAITASLASRPFRQPYQARDTLMQENGAQPYFLRSTPSSAFTKSKCRVDGLVHVVVLISAQTTSEHHVAFPAWQASTYCSYRALLRSSFRG